ncbi:MAG: hypothetical protein R3Y43_03245 [Alphaproteobacteria bacterium]
MIDKQEIKQKLRLAENLLYFLDCYNEKTQTIKCSSKRKQLAFDEMEKLIGVKLAVFEGEDFVITPIGYCIVLEVKKIKELLEEFYNYKKSKIKNDETPINRTENKFLHQ